MEVVWVLNASELQDQRKRELAMERHSLDAVEKLYRSTGLVV